MFVHIIYKLYKNFIKPNADDQEAARCPNQPVWTPPGRPMAPVPQE